MSNNKIICSNSDDYLRVRNESNALNRGLCSKYRSRLFSTDGVTLATTWSNAIVETFTPFYCSFFESPENYLDLSFV
jgi:hypothetical protein